MMKNVKKVADAIRFMADRIEYGDVDISNLSRIHLWVHVENLLKTPGKRNLHIAYTDSDKDILPDWCTGE